MSVSEKIVLLVDADDTLRGGLATAISSHRVVEATSAEEALGVLGREAVGLVVSATTLRSGDGLSFLKEVGARWPQLPRMLWVGHDELPGIMRDKVLTELSRVLPRPGKPAILARAIRERLELDDPFEDGNHTAERGNLGGALWRAGLALARLPGAVIRSPPPDAVVSQIQVVVPQGDGLDAVRDGLSARFGAPWKKQGAPLPRTLKGHPVPRLFSPLEKNQELFVLEPSPGVFCYVALLPWSRAPKCTAVVGLLEDEDPIRGVLLLKTLREQLLLELSQIALPKLEGGTVGQATYVPEYDWVVTPNYAGPDRRAKPTGFANSFLVVGKRSKLPRGLEVFGGFVDRLERWTLWCFVAYVVLSSIDTVLTWHFVGTGVVRELNPILRPLIGKHPLTFLAVKNGFSLSSFFFVARFQLFWFGRGLVAANLLLYLVLDAYWAFLLLR